VTGRPDFVVGEPRAGDDDEMRVPVSIPEDLKYLEGHFPGSPIVPGIAQLLMVERAARACWGDLAAPERVQRLKFQRALGPGDELELRLTRKEGTVRFALYRGDDECSRGTVRFRT